MLVVLTDVLEGVACQPHRFGGSEARKRYDKYGGAIFPVAWYDLQQFWARRLPAGALQLDSSFESYEETEDAVIVHLKV